MERMVRFNKQMKYIGNYKSWMEEQQIMEHLTKCQGDRTPVW